MIGRRSKRHTTGDQGANTQPPILSIRVSSRVPGADFEALLYPTFIPGNTALVDNRWRHKAYLLACDHLRAVTEEHAVERLVQHHTAAELAINAALATPLVLTQPIQVNVTGHVTLVPASNSTPATEDYVNNLRDERIRNDRALARLEFLRTDVFADRCRAWSWWADLRPDKLHVLPAETFATMLVALDTARETAPVQDEVSERDSFAHVLSDFISGTDPEHATLAIGILHQYLSHFDRADLVERVSTLVNDNHQTGDADDEPPSRQLTNDHRTGDVHPDDHAEEAS